jgi:uncharacterized membrane protein
VGTPEVNALAKLGRCVFAGAIIALGALTLVCAHARGLRLGTGHNVFVVLPFEPAILWLVICAGIIFVACGLGLLIPATRLATAIFLGALLFVSAIIQIQRQAGPVIFEPLSMGALAWMLTREGREGILPRVGRYLLIICLVDFGWDHFHFLQPFADLIPAPVPWHRFWIVFFGVAFFATAAALLTGILRRVATVCLGTMFCIWVFTLHLWHALGIFKIRNYGTPDAWCSLFIAAALWGGFWALSAKYE